VSEAAREAMWLRMLTTELGFPPLRPTPLLCDNQAALVLAEDPSFHTRAKHINIKWHYIRECTENSNISVSYVPSRNNVADILTKALPTQQFVRLRLFLGLCNYPWCPSRGGVLVLFWLFYFTSFTIIHMPLHLYLYHLSSRRGGVLENMRLDTTYVQIRIYATYIHT
jgi:hypothetical protein